MERVPSSILFTSGNGSYIINWPFSESWPLDGCLVLRWLLKALSRSPFHEQLGYEQWIQSGRWDNRCLFRSCMRANDDEQSEAGQRHLLGSCFFGIGVVGTIPPWGGENMTQGGCMKSIGLIGNP